MKADLDMKSIADKLWNKKEVKDAMENVFDGFADMMEKSQTYGAHSSLVSDVIRDTGMKFNTVESLAYVKKCYQMGEFNKCNIFLLLKSLKFTSENGSKKQAKVANDWLAYMSRMENTEMLDIVTYMGAKEKASLLSEIIISAASLDEKALYRQFSAKLRKIPVLVIIFDRDGYSHQEVFFRDEKGLFCTNFWKKSVHLARYYASFKN